MVTDVAIKQAIAYCYLKIRSPMVGMYLGLKTYPVNLDKRHDLPTYPSPTSTSQNNSS